MAYLRTQKRKNPKTKRLATYWSINWRDHRGKIRQKALGYINEREASRALAAFEERLQSGEFLDLDPPPSSSPTSSQTGEGRILGEFLDETYLPRVRRDKAPKTYRIRNDGATALKRRLADVPLSALSFRVLDDYITDRSSEVRSRTIQLEMSCLRQALKLAVQRGELDDLPRFPTVPLNDAKPHRFLDEEETRALLDAMDPRRPQPHDVTRGKPPLQRDQWSWLAVFMALNTGMRSGEILSREWSDVKWHRGAHGAIHIGHKPKLGYKVKMGRPRTIPMTPELREVLEQARSWSDAKWIFPSPRNPKVPRKSFARALTNACERAGIEHIHPHGLRHSWASRLAQAGVYRRTLMDLGGWKTSRLLDEIYSHVTDDHMDEVMSRMGIPPRDEADDDVQEEWDDDDDLE